MSKIPMLAALVAAALTANAQSTVRPLTQDDAPLADQAATDIKDVVVSAKEVADPVVVRYAFRANPLGKCGLYNKEGLPASPFSVDVAKLTPAEPAK